MTFDEFEDVINTACENMVREINSKLGYVVSMQDLHNNEVISEMIDLCITNVDLDLDD